MKKLFVILLTLALMITLIGNVSADTGLTIKDDDTTDVVYQVSPTYIITVPAGISFTKATDEVYGWVNATNLVLEAEKIVTVSVTSENDGKMVTRNAEGTPVGSGLDYKLYTRDHSSGAGSFSAEEVQLSSTTPVTILTYTIPDEDNGDPIEKRIELKFTLDISGKQNLLSGSYKDTLTFTASYSGTI